MILTPLSTSITPLLPTTPTFTRPIIADNTPVNALAANANRKKAFLINYTDWAFWVKEDVDAAMNQGFQLRPGDIYSVLSTKRVSVIQQSGGNLTLDAADVV